MADSDKEPSIERLNHILSQCEEWHRTRYGYDVALSFSGKDRKFTEKLAELLVKNGVKVFCDKYEQENLFGKVLYTQLSDIYTNCCR